MKMRANLCRSTIGGIFWQLSDDRHVNSALLIDSNFEHHQNLLYRYVSYHPANIVFHIDPGNNMLIFHIDYDVVSRKTIKLGEWNETVKRAEEAVQEYDFILVSSVLSDKTEETAYKRPKTPALCYRIMPNRSQMWHKWWALNSIFCGDIAALICGAILELIRCDTSWYIEAF